MNAGIIDAGGLGDGIMLCRGPFSPSSCIPLPKFKLFAISLFVRWSWTSWLWWADLVGPIVLGESEESDGTPCLNLFVEAKLFFSSVFFLLLKFPKMLDLLVATIVAQISLDVNSAYVYIQNNGHPFSQILYFSFQTCSFSWISLLCTTKQASGRTWSQRFYGCFTARIQTRFSH